MRPRLLLAAALTALTGCAAPQGDARLTWDAANCRRHALEGPGGPSRMVSSSFGSTTPSRNSRRSNTAAQAASTLLASRDRDPVVTAREDVYRDCMRARGYSMPGLHTMDPERIGALERPGRAA